MSLSKKYKFFLDIPGEGEVEVFPCNDQLKWLWEKDDDLKAWRLHLDTTLIFGNEEVKYLFTNFNHKWYIASASKDGGPLENEKPLGAAFSRMQQRVWNNIKRETHKEMQIIVNSLQSDIGEELKENDW